MYKREAKGWAKHLDFMILDLVCLAVVMIFSYINWFGFLNPFKNSIFIQMFVIILLMDFALLLILNTLKNILKNCYRKVLKNTVHHTLVLIAAVLAYMYLIQLQLPKYMLASTIISYALVTFSVRILWKCLLMKRMNKQLGNSLLIMADEETLPELIREVRENNFSSKRIAGIVVPDPGKIGVRYEGVPVVASNRCIVNYVKNHWVDEILISMKPDEGISKEMMNTLIAMGVTLHMHLQNDDFALESKQVLSQIGGLQVISNTMNYVGPRSACLKRLIDILGGLAGCFITGILCIFLAPAIKRESPGPIFFAQTRIGKNGKEFKIYKFRSMYMDAEERKKELMSQNRMKDGLMFKMDFDPRIIGNRIDPDGTKHTGIGEFIRKYSLDEFPQFYNVLKGDMSLVGTRPPVMSEYQQYSAHHKARLAIKPGITGLWQTSGRSNIIDFEEVVKLDTQYINNWSFGLDLRILFKTVAVVLKKEGSM